MPGGTHLRSLCFCVCHSRTDRCLCGTVMGPACLASRIISCRASSCLQGGGSSRAARLARCPLSHKVNTHELISVYPHVTHTGCGTPVGFIHIARIRRACAHHQAAVPSFLAGPIGIAERRPRAHTVRHTCRPWGPSPTPPPTYPPGREVLPAAANGQEQAVRPWRRCAGECPRSGKVRGFPRPAADYGAGAHGSAPVMALLAA